MKKITFLSSIAFALLLFGCSSDDESCECYSTGKSSKENNEYFVFCRSTNDDQVKKVKVDQGIFEWVNNGNITQGDCFDVNKYEID